jgi:hypothetical protein
MKMGGSAGRGRPWSDPHGAPSLSLEMEEGAQGLCVTEGRLRYEERRRNALPHPSSVEAVAVSPLETLFLSSQRAWWIERPLFFTSVPLPPVSVRTGQASRLSSIHFLVCHFSC